MDSSNNPSSQLSSSTSVMKTKAPSRITILSQLETYASTDPGREEGGKALKSCFWQLTRARQSKAKGAMPMESAFLASNVREEFEARTRVKIVDCGSVPILLDDDDDDEAAGAGTTEPPNKPPTFVLCDTLEEYRRRNYDSTQDGTTDSTILATTAPQPSKEEGLRQRKNKKNNEDKENRKENKGGEGISSSSSWELVDELDGKDDEVIPKEFQVSSPLALIGGGFPPRELKRAHEEAQKALASYIQAANAAAVLLHSLRQATIMEEVRDGQEGN